MSFSALPKSFIWFALTAVIFGLQLFPLTGVFLMMVGAPLWSIITVNLGFISLALEALFRRTHIAWLILPLLWFGGYAGLAAYSHSRAAVLDQQLREANAKVRVDFSPERQSIVFAQPSGVLSSGAGAMVSRYGLDVAYAARTHLKTAKHLASRLGGKVLCAEMRKNTSYRDAGASVANVRVDRKAVRDVCIYHVPEDPTLPAIEIASKEHKVKSAILPYTYRAISVRDASGVSNTLMSGHAAPLAWLPMPVIGCALNSSAPSWDCSAGFWRSRMAIGGDGFYGAQATDVVAKALGLRQVAVESRVAAVNAGSQSPPTIVLKDSLDVAIAALERVIAKPDERIYLSDVKLLRSFPEEIGKRQEKIVDAVKARLTAPTTSGWETARALEGLLSELPDDRFLSAGRALLPLVALPDRWGQESLPGDFMVRLGDLGADAVPKLEALAFANPRRANAAAILGLCRAGAAAKPLADKIASILKQEKVERRLHQAAYVTLLRLGRKDLTTDATLPASARRAATYHAWAETISPESPASVCVTANGWPKLPDAHSKAP